MDLVGYQVDDKPVLWYDGQEYAGGTRTGDGYLCVSDELIEEGQNVDSNRNHGTIGARQDDRNADA